MPRLICLTSQYGLQMMHMCRSMLGPWTGGRSQWTMKYGSQNLALVTAPKFGASNMYQNIRTGILGYKSRNVFTSAIQEEASKMVIDSSQNNSDFPSLMLYNTLSRKKELFVPRKDQGSKVSMYVCGVTVYDYSHIGHARVYVAFDVLYRFLSSLGYDVTYVRNFTDIDDKIIARAEQSGENPLDLSRRFIVEFHQDMEALGCLRPTIEPLATDHIDDMIRSIQNIIDHGHGYVTEGDVFFDVDSLPGYGKLSGRSQENNRAGERVAIDSRKKSAADFALWKSAKPGEPTWDSPWGPGRPGWHIECSAMINSILGDTVDIHGGGQDLVFPHHENELAQARATASPCSCHHKQDSSDPEFVRYWVHNGFVNVDAEKMSKSLGNFFTIRDVLKQYHPFAMRLFLINTHYRQGVNYTQRGLEEASDRLYYIYQTIADIQDHLDEIGEDGVLARNQAKSIASEKPKVNVKKANSGEQEAAELFSDVMNAMADDLNTPAAIAALSSPMKHLNELLHTKKGRKTLNRSQILAFYEHSLLNIMKILGLWTGDFKAALEDLKKLALKRAGISEEELDSAIDERASARAAKDFEAADAVRLRLEALGILIMDTPSGTTWKPGPRLDIHKEEDVPVTSSH